jgi:16S rRNA (adenine1518-N6/adenine1519-N6)-dimethyltransferase
VDAAAALPAPRRIVANLPYNVATPLLSGWLRGAAAIEGMTLMFQQEWRSGSAPRRTPRPMGGSACWRSGAAARPSCCACRPAPSRPRQVYSAVVG